MTGIAGCIGPFEPGLARGLAGAIAYMGPDRQDEWQGDRAFLARSLLAQTFEDDRDSQPLSFEGRFHLIADARIDGREELTAALRAAGRRFDDDAPDSALILHAWHVWGERCPERLIGDYAFAIWDSQERSLFAARDQIGTVPFYYSRVGDQFLFANTVRALLAHPGVDRSLNPLAIGDYLMFSYGIDRDAGFFRGIARLAPAHCMMVTESEVRIRRFWDVPDADFAAAEKRAPEELIEEFRATFAGAVRDRLRMPKVATTLSGGMDSTSIAATAMREGAGQTHIEAWSYGGDWLMPDVERHWAWRCAHHIGVPFNSLSVERVYTDPPGGHFHAPPEPRMELRTNSVHLVAEAVVSRGYRVLLLGMGGDTIVRGGPFHWGKMVRERRFGRLMREAWQFWRYHRLRPPLRAAWRASRPMQVPPISAPLDPDFVREHRLEERWRWVYDTYQADTRKMMGESPFWTELFVATHPESSGLPLRFRQPMFDVRLIELAMRLPPTPWQFHKAMLRRMGEGLLPDEIINRPKTLFGNNPAWEAARRGLEPWLNDLPLAAELDGYVDKERIRRAVADIAALPPLLYYPTVTVPASLAVWLRAQKAS